MLDVLDQEARHADLVGQVELDVAGVEDPFGDMIVDVVLDERVQPAKALCPVFERPGGG